MKTEDTFHWHVQDCCRLCNIHVILLLSACARFENFVLVKSARTDAQYYSSSFFCSPFQSLENSYSYCRLSPIHEKTYFSFASPLKKTFSQSLAWPAGPSSPLTGLHKIIYISDYRREKTEESNGKPKRIKWMLD